MKWEHEILHLILRIWLYALYYKVWGSVYHKCIVFIKRRIYENSHLFNYMGDWIFFLWAKGLFLFIFILLNHKIIHNDFQACNVLTQIPLQVSTTIYWCYQFSYYSSSVPFQSVLLKVHHGSTLSFNKVLGLVNVMINHKKVI